MNDLSRRGLLTAAGAGAVAVALAGCAQLPAAADTGAAGFGEGASGTLRIWTRSAVQTGMAAVVKAFQRSQSRIRVELTPVLDAQYVTKLATAIRAGGPPDLVDFDDINSTLFAYRGVFTDLTPLIERLGFLGSLSPGHLRLATIDGRHYGVPFLADNSLLFLNTELFERAGVDIGTATRDHASLLDAAKRITALGGGIQGWSFPGDAAGALGFTVQPFYWAGGARAFAGKLGSQKAAVAGNAAIRSTLQLHRDLWTSGSVARSANADQALTWGADFVAGKVGIFPSNWGSIYSKADKAFLPKIRTALISGPDGGTSFFDGGDNLCIPRGARNPSAAWEFARFALGLAQQQALPAAGYTPVRADANTAAFRQRYPLVTLPLENLQRGYAPQTLAYNLIFNQQGGPWLQMFRRAVFDGQVEQAMESAQTDYQRLLNQVQE